MDEITLSAVDQLLREAHPEYTGYTKSDETITWMGYTPTAAELDDLAAQASAELLRQEQEQAAIYQAVEVTRPLDLAAFMTADQAAVDQYISHNGINTAIYSIIRVLQYLTACKDRAKLD